MYNKLFAIVTATLLCAGTATAQKSQQDEPSYPRFYTRAGLGYGIPHGGLIQGALYGLNSTDLLPLNGNMTINNTAPSPSRSYNMKKVSHAAGLKGVLAFGAEFTKHLGAEVAINTILSPQETLSNLESIQTQTTYNITIAQQPNNPLFITPSIVVQTGGKINVYSRGGIVLPIFTMVTQSVDYRARTLNPADSTYVNSQITLTEDFSMRFAPGFSGAVGVQYAISPRLNIWAEAGILSMTLYYKQSEITSYSEDGVSRLGEIAPSDRITTYDFEGNIGSGANIVPTTQVPFSNFNISAGVKVPF